ncbi:MAG: hypothetical protein ABFD69_10030 [Candidatus Sumerlaeia bacterium]
MVDIVSRIGVVWFMLIFVVARAAAPSPNDGFVADTSHVVVLQVQPDGKILAATDGLAVVRLKTDGARDTNYTPFAANGAIKTMAVQPDGSAIVGGYFYTGATGRYIARLKPDGGLDATFVSSINTLLSDHVNTVAVLPDGKILVAGNFNNLGASLLERPGLARLFSNGGVDASFVPPRYGSNNVATVAVQPDGKIVVAGNLGGSTRLMRLFEDGSVDASFESGINADNSSLIRKLIPQPDGSLLVDGSLDVSGVTKDTILRLKPDGSLDPDFSMDNNRCMFGAQQADGKIVASGNRTVSGVITYGFLRYNIDGSIDPTWHSETDVNTRDIVTAIQSDGKVLFGFNDGGLYRLNTDGSMDEDFNFAASVDFSVMAMTSQPDGKTILGGDFTRVYGIPRNRIARLNSDCSLDHSFNAGVGTNKAVTGIGVQPDGKIVIVGAFSRAGGQWRNNIARLNADGSLDAAFNPNVSGSIGKMWMRPDGKFLLSGPFKTIGGTTCTTIARLNANGTVDPTFDPVFGSSADKIDCVEVQPSGKVLISGKFALFGATERMILRMNSDGSLDREFTTIRPNRVARNMFTRSDGRILVAEYSTVDSEGTCTRIRAYNALGFPETFDSWFHLDGAIYSIVEQDDGKILLGGDFEQQGVSIPEDLHRINLARLNPDGVVDRVFKTIMTNGAVYAFSLRQDARILLGGAFTRIATGRFLINTWHTPSRFCPRRHLALLEADGGFDTLLEAPVFAPDGEISAVATDCDQGFFVGGKFKSIYRYPVPGAARMTVGAALDSTFAPQARQASVMAALPDGRVMLCDCPTSGSQGHVLTRRNADGTTDTSFGKVRVDARVDSMLLQPDGGVIIAGNFHQVGGRTLHQVARVDGIGSVTLTFNTGHGFDAGELHYLHHGDEDSTDLPDELIIEHRGRVNSVALQSGGIIAGGLFDRIAYVDRANVARLDMNGIVDTTFDPGIGADGEVFAVAVQPDGKVLIAGAFQHVDGVIRNGVARLNPDGALDETFVPDTGEFNYFHTLALQADGKIVMGGFYSSNSGYGRIARLNADGSLDALFEAPESMVFDFADVNAIALQADGKLLVGGAFGNIGEVSRSFLARVSNPDAALQTLSVAPGGSAVTWKLGGAYPQPYQVFFENSSDGLTWNELGWGTPVPGVGFRMRHLRLPITANYYVRATGWATGGLNNGSVSLHRSTLYFNTPAYNASPDWACYE